MVKGAKSWREYLIKRYTALGSEYKPVQLKESIRINNLRISETALISRMEKKGLKLVKVPYLTYGYFVEQSRFSLGSSVEHLLGYYFVQESAAQLAVEVLNPKPGELVLDACAAPGGKTTQLAQFMKNKGTIIACESKRERTKPLKLNVERMHCTNVIAYAMDAYNISKLGLQYDKILLDAPCAGNYVIDEGWFEKRDIHGIQASAHNQRALIEACINALKPNGILVYSTCSLEPEENELNMQWVLENFDIDIIPCNLEFGDPGLTHVFEHSLHHSLANCRRLWPAKTGTQGFFIAKIQKRPLR